MLTVKQKKLLDFLIQYYNKNNVYPTFDEMRDFLQIKSKSGIHKLLSSLEEKGFVNRLPHKARALSINTNVNEIESGRTNGNGIYYFYVFLCMIKYTCF